MTTIVDQLEKVGRLVLWIAIAIVFALVPIGLYGRDKQAAKDAEQARVDRAKEKAAEIEAKKASLLPLASMGDVMRALDGSTGFVWFSNATPREGYVCIKGIASVGAQTSESLSSCRHVDAFETNVKMSVMFAGADIKAMCPTTPCQFSVRDAGSTDVRPAPVALKAQ